MFKHAALPRVRHGNGPIAYPSHGEYPRYGRTLLQSGKNLGGDSERKVCHNIWNANYVGEQGQNRCMPDCLRKFDIVRNDRFQDKIIEIA